MLQLYKWRWRSSSTKWREYSDTSFISWSILWTFPKNSWFKSPGTNQREAKRSYIEEIIKHENGYIQVKAPKSIWLDLISNTQSNHTNCICRDGSDDLDDEEDEEVSETEMKKQSESLNVEKLGLKDDFLRNNVNESMKMLKTVSGLQDEFENFKSTATPKLVNSESDEVSLNGQYTKVKFALKSLNMIKDLMSSSRIISFSYKKKYVPLSILLNHKITYSWKYQYIL